MSKRVTLSGLMILGGILCALPAFAQGAGSPAAPTPALGAQAPDNAAPTMAAGTSAPVVNPPDPQNAGTLAENLRTTALATYPWSTADLWFGRR
jgi:hypothetical protein